MAESLSRSRSKWINEGIFEKYWTKPTKKNRAELEAAKNPQKDTMVRIGNCTITVEPHVFDATMFSVKNPNPPAPVSTPSQAMYRPIIQYGPPGGMMPQPPPPPPPQPQPQPQPPPQQSVTQAPAPFTPRPAEGATKAPSAPASSNTAPVQSSHHQSQSHPQHAAPNPQSQPSQPPPSTLPPAQTPPNPATPSAPPAKSSDPVIQMLAERAATDQELKALMRIVADGKASTDELKRFQAHIDELTKLLHARQAATAPHPPANPPGPALLNSRPQQAPVAAPRPIQNPPVQNARPSYHPPPPQPQALRSKGPPPPSKQDVSAVVFEFNGGSGDRFLFPKYSILDYLPGNIVIASFLIVRKGSSADSKKYDSKLDYYQPITIRLYAHQGKQLETLAKVVAPQDEVRRYMDDIMDNATRAEYVLLAMQLPRDSDRVVVHDEDEKMQNGQPDDGVLWTTSANPPPTTKQKATKKPLTEQEQYQNLITNFT
jgi:uncharacterized coiled-coil protein SlyX